MLMIYDSQVLLYKDTYTAVCPEPAADHLKVTRVDLRCIFDLSRDAGLYMMAGVTKGVITMVAERAQLSWTR